MNSLEKALAWMNLGVEVLPCRPQDEWVGGMLRKAKSPYIDNGVSGASSDVALVTPWFSSLYTDALVGIKAGRLINVADVDLDLDLAIDGAFELSEKGLELPETFSYQTRRGGWHYLYRGDPEGRLGPLAPVLDRDYKPIKGVDRRAGESYFIPWGDDVPKSLSDLSHAPDWLTVPSKSSSLNEYSKGLRAWLDEVPDGNPTPEVLAAANSIPSEPFGHTLMISLQRRLVGLAASGHTGVPAALADLRHAWLAGEYNTTSNLRDWTQSLEGAVAKFGAINLAPDTEDNLEIEIQKIIRRKKAEREAELRLQSENNTLTEVMTWEELSDVRRDYLVEDLVPSGGLIFLVARSNLGKTLTYVDLLCRSVFGMSWLGKATKQIKALVVVSEGKSGFLARFESWCEYHGKDVEEVKKWIVPVSGANLNNKSSLIQLSKIADENDVNLIIFDTYSNTSGLVDEDAAGPASLTISNAKTIKTDAAILFTHHPRKSDENTRHPEPRGSGVPKAASDVVITMFRDNDRSLPAGNQWISLSTESQHAGKNRDAKTETIRGLRLDQTKTETPVMIWSKENLVPDSIRKIEAALTGEMTLRELAETLSLSSKTIDRYLSLGIKMGRITRITSGAANKPHRYRLKD